MCTSLWWWHQRMCHEDLARELPTCPLFLLPPSSSSASPPLHHLGPAAVVGQAEVWEETETQSLMPSLPQNWHALITPLGLARLTANKITFKCSRDTAAHTQTKTHKHIRTSLLSLTALRVTKGRNITIGWAAMATNAPVLAGCGVSKRHLLANSGSAN